METKIEELMREIHELRKEIKTLKYPTNNYPINVKIMEYIDRRIFQLHAEQQKYIDLYDTDTAKDILCGNKNITNLDANELRLIVKKRRKELKSQLMFN